MRWLANIPLRGKLVGLTAMLLIGAAIVSGASLLALDNSSRSDQRLADAVARVEEINTARVLLARMQRNAWLYTQTGATEALYRFTEARDTFFPTIDQIIARSSSDPQARAQWEALRDEANEWLQIANEGIAYRDDLIANGGERNIAFETSLQFRDDEHYSLLVERFAELAQDEQAAISEALDRHGGDHTSVVRLNAIGAVILVTLGAVGTILLYRDISPALARLTRAASHLQAGDLTERVRLHRGDELGQAAAAFDAMADRLQASMSELGRGAADLARERDLLRAFMDNTAEGILVTDRAGVIIQVNTPYIRLSGHRDPGELLGKVASEVLPPHLNEASERKARAVIASGQPILNELFELTNEDHEPCWFLRSWVPILGKDGEVASVVESIRDVTELQRTQRALEESEARLWLALDAAAMVTWEWDIASNLVEVTTADPENGARIVQQLAGSLDVLMATVEPADREEAVARVWQAIERREAFYQEIRVNGPDGTRWFGMWGHTIYDEAGQPLRMIGLLMDIHARKTAEIALKESQEQLEQAISAAQLSTWAWNIKDGSFSITPPGSAEVINLPQKFPDAESLFKDIVSPEDLPQIVQTIEETIDHGTSYSIEIRRRYPDGTYRWEQSWGRVTRDEQGEPLYLRGVLLDIHDRKAAQERLAASEARYRELFAEATRQANELALVNEISARLSGSTDLASVMRSAVEILHENKGYQLINAYLIEGDDLVLSHQIGYERPIARSPRSAGVMGRVSRTGQPALVLDPSLEPDFIRSMPGITSKVCVPLFDRDRVVGVLNIETTGEQFTQDDLELLTTLSHPIDLAISRAVLYQELQEREQRFRALIQNAPDSIIVLAPDGTMTFQSPAFARTLGYSPGEIIKDPLSDHIHPEDRPRYRAGFERMLVTEGQTETFQIRLRRQSGDYAWMEMTWSNMVRTPYINGIVINGRDVTERERANEAREHQYREAVRARGEFRAVLDAASEAMVMVSPNLTVSTANRRVSELFGIDPEEIVRFSTEELVSLIKNLFVRGGELASFLVNLVLDSERVETHIVQQRLPVERELEIFSAPVHGINQEYLGRLIAFRDVTREREVDRMKTEFVSLVSHELRTPLTSIKGYVDLLLEGEVGDLEPEQREFLEIVGNNAVRLVSLINDLLDISRIESGKIELMMASQDVAATLHGVAASLRPQIEAKGQELVLHIPDDLPVIEADQNRLAQIFTNLLSNAHKYTPGGGTISVSATVEGESVRVDVSDTGIGMTQAELDQLFTRFYRAKNRTTQEVGGTGLGLSITKSLVEMHGGSIEVRSQPNHGSTFTVRFPISRAETQPEPTEQPPLTHGGHVLVVEDEADIANLIRRYLERAGYEVTVALNGTDALRLAKAERPDLITLDLMLPDANGMTVLEWLKSDEATKAIPVMLLSVMPDNGTGRQLGAVDYVAKPVEERFLIDRVGRLLNREAPGRVLLADDVADNRRLIANLLTKAGYEVVEARDGDEVLELVSKEDFDLVLLDVRMPGRDGIQTLQALRNEPKSRHWPVIMMTGSRSILESLAVTRPKLEELGVTSLLQKPFSAEELARTITRERGQANGGHGSARSPQPAATLVTEAQQ